jgi:hypothetical protein
MGSGYLCRTPALHTTWQWVQQEIPERLRSQLADCCFVLLKPDLLAAGKQDLFWDRLLATGAQPLVAWACLRSGLREFEELYKFNLTVNNDQCMLSSWWLHNRPYQMGPVVGLLVRVAKDRRGEVGACDFIGRHKGPSNPFRATRGQWRYDIVSTNMALNLVHTADDPISSVREFRVFGSAELLRRALTRCRRLANDTAAADVVTAVRAEFSTAIDLLGYPRHDLDLVTNLVRIKLRLAQATDPDGWISPALTEQYLGLLRSTGPVGRRWSAYRALCDLEDQHGPNGSAPEALARLARVAEYRPELADLIEGELRRHRLPYSDWERVVMETSLFFHHHLPTQ